MPTKRPLRPAQTRSWKPLPEKRAHDVVAHENSAPGNKAGMTFRVVLRRQQLETLATRSIRKGKNIGIVCVWPRPSVCR
jgi:hypothetical protein